MFEHMRGRRQRERLLRYIISQYPFRVTRVVARPNKFVITTTEGTKALHSHNGPAEELWLAWLVFEQLQSSSVLKMLRWHETRSGYPYLSIEGETYYVTDWLEGQPLDNERSNYEAIFSTLAKLHLVSREVLLAQDFDEPLKSPVPHPSLWSQQLAWLEAYTEALKVKTHVSSFEAGLVKSSGRMLELGRQAFSLLSDVVYEKDMGEGCALKFGGFDAHNLLLVNGEEYYIPVHQNYEWGWRIDDLAQVIRQMGYPSKEELRKVIGAYKAIIPLRDWELASLPGVLTYPYRFVELVQHFRKTGEADRTVLSELEQGAELSKGYTLRLQSVIKEIGGQRNTVIVVDPEILAEFTTIKEGGKLVDESKRQGEYEDVSRELEESAEDLGDFGEDSQIVSGGEDSQRSQADSEDFAEIFKHPHTEQENHEENEPIEEPDASVEEVDSLKGNNDDGEEEEVQMFLEEKSVEVGGVDDDDKQIETTEMGDTSEDRYIDEYSMTELDVLQSEKFEEADNIAEDKEMDVEEAEEQHEASGDAPVDITAIEELIGEETPVEDEQEDSTVQSETEDIQAYYKRAEEFKQQYSKLITWGPFPKPITQQNEKAEEDTELDDSK